MGKHRAEAAEGIVEVDFTLGGVTKTYRYPASRLDELLDAADRRFGCTNVDPHRFAAALKISKGKPKEGKS